MPPSSPYHQLRQIEFMVGGLRPGMDASRATHKAYDTLHRRVLMAQHTVRDYERSAEEEDTKAQLRLLPKVVKGLEEVRDSILVASQYDLVGAVDVAQLSAQLDELIDRLR